MNLVNTETVAGHRITRTLGLVQGNTVRAKHMGRDFMAGLKNLVGGSCVATRSCSSRPGARRSGA